MKEADITFNELYHLDVDGETVCGRVLRKMPPAEGAKRSRTYVYHPSDNPNNTNYIDASKIVEYWSEYEKTPEYVSRHYQEVKDRLDERLEQAVRSWENTFVEYLQTRFPGSNVFGRLTSPTSIKDLSTLLEQITADKRCHLTVDQLLPLIDNMAYPPTDQIEEAWEAREELQRQTLRPHLPTLERGALAAAKEWSKHAPRSDYGGDLWDNVHAYVNALDEIQEPGPHQTLIDVMHESRRYDWFVKLTEIPLFSYLINHIPVSTGESDGDEV